MTFDDRYKTILEQLQPGTGRWLLKHDNFVDWLTLQATSSILWLRGIPGSGKTFLAALVIDHLYKTSVGPGIGIVYILCDYKDPRQTFETLQRAVLRQLLQQMEIVPDEIIQLYDRHLMGSAQPDVEEVQSILMSAAARFSQIVIIIDALDEVSGTEGTSGSLLKLCKDIGTTTNSRALITSRWTGDLDYHIRQHPNIEILAKDEDVSLYLSNEMSKWGRIQRFVQKDPSFKEEIVNTILRQCRGMFLVARLHIASLAAKTNLRAARLALQKLPCQLDTIYSDATDRINTQAEEDLELAWRVLGWIVRSEVPLSGIQLQHALAVDIDDDELDHDAFIDLDVILAVCAGLVVLDANSSVIRLVHFTAQEFFERHGARLLPRADCDISQVCIKYLSYDATGYFSMTDQDLAVKLETFPFYEYAAKNWGTHCKRCSCDDIDLDGRVDEFFGDTGRVDGAAQGMLCSQQRYRGWSQNLVRDVLPIHLTAHFGMTEAIKPLVKSQTLNCRDTAGRTPLHWAARGGHTELARLLLENGAEVDALDNVYATSLHLACRYGRLEFASMLIQNHSNVNAANNVGGTALIWAAIKGSMEVSSLLLDYGADVNAMTNNDVTALSRAVEVNNEAMVKLLIKHGADANYLAEATRQRPLCLATRQENEPMMRILLEAGALPDMRTSDFDISKTTLGSALMAKSNGPVRLLLDYGLDFNKRGLHGETPVHYAAKLGNIATFSLLVEYGCQLAAVDENGSTVLHVAINEENEQNGGDIVRKITGLQIIDLGARDIHGHTALEMAQALGLGTITQLLSDAEKKQAAYTT